MAGLFDKLAEGIGRHRAIADAMRAEGERLRAEREAAAATEPTPPVIPESPPGPAGP